MTEPTVEKIGRSMEERFEAYRKKYPDEDMKALWNAREWIADKDYIYAHMGRVQLQSKRFGFALYPTSGIMGMNRYLREAAATMKGWRKEEVIMERLFLIHDITLSVTNKLRDGRKDAEGKEVNRTDEDVLEWLDWRQVAGYMSGGVEPHIPQGMVGDHQLDAIYRDVERLDDTRVRCPSCGALPEYTEVDVEDNITHWCPNFDCETRTFTE